MKLNIHLSVVKVEFSLSEAMKAQKGSRGTGLIFLNFGARLEVGGQRHAPAALPPGKRPGTHCTGGWMGPSAGMDGCGQSRPHRDTFPGRSSP